MMRILIAALTRFEGGAKMTWEHFDIRDEGACLLQARGDAATVDAHYAIGIVTTGKQRAFWGCQMIIRLPDREIVGRSKGNSDSYLPVLRETNKLLAAMNLILLVAGNAPSYSESALSGGGGRGYVDGSKSALRIMSVYRSGVVPH
jgi:hypothetical protein